MSQIILLGSRPERKTSVYFHFKPTLAYHPTGQFFFRLLCEIERRQSPQTVFLSLRTDPKGMEGKESYIFWHLDQDLAHRKRSIIICRMSEPFKFLSSIRSSQLHFKNK